MDLTPAGGKRRQRWGSGFPTKDAAEAERDRVLGELRTGTYVERSAQTLAEYLDSWWKAGDWKGNTRRDYRVAILRHVGPTLGSARLQDITRPDVKALYQSLLEKGNARTGEGLTRKTVLNVHRCLRAALNDAVRDGLLRSNPAAEAFSYSKARERKEMLTWTVEEIHTFLAFVVETREHGLYHLALASGMRRGELLGLRRRDLDLDGARLRVRQQWTKDGDAGRRFITLKTGTRAWRTIDLDDLTIEVLRRHLGNQEFERRARRDAYRADLDLVFCKPDGSPHDPDEATRRFERRAAACPGVLGIRFHDMRHTHATLLLESGESVKYVAERLGDREDTVVETYAHVTPKMRSAAVSKVRTFMGADPAAQDGSVVRPRAETGERSRREPPVSPQGDQERKDALGEG